MAEVRTSRPLPKAPAAAPGGGALFPVAMVFIVLMGVAVAGVLLSGDPRSKRSAGAGDGGSIFRTDRPAGYQPAPFLPNAPISTNSPFGDTPDITIVEDTRAILRRLPLDRNTPQGWQLPTPAGH